MISNSLLENCSGSFSSVSKNNPCVHEPHLILCQGSCSTLGVEFCAEWFPGI